MVHQYPSWREVSLKKCCGCRGSPWGQGDTEPGQEHGMGAWTWDRDEESQRCPRGWMGRGWESMLRSPRAGGSYGAQGHRQARLGGVKGSKIQGPHRGKALQHLRARAHGGGNEMMSWEPSRTLAHAPQPPLDEVQDRVEARPSPRQH